MNFNIIPATNLELKSTAKINNYPHPFGMQIQNREYTNDGGGYRFGFNGMERDDEVKGDGNSLDFGARIYDSRLGRWMSVDPFWHKYPNSSNYIFSGNNPIYWIDTDGNDIIPTHNFNSVYAQTVRTVVNSFIADEGSTFSQKYLTKYYGQGQTDLKLHFGYLEPKPKETPGEIQRTQASTTFTDDGPVMITFNILSQVNRTEDDEQNYWVITDNGWASAFIHEVIYHANGRQRGHNISITQFDDAIAALKKYNPNLTDKQAVAMMAANTDNVDELLTHAKQEYNVELTSTEASTISFNMVYKKEEQVGTSYEYNVEFPHESSEDGPFNPLDTKISGTFKEPIKQSNPPIKKE